MRFIFVNVNLVLAKVACITYATIYVSLILLQQNCCGKFRFVATNRGVGVFIRQPV